MASVVAQRVGHPPTVAVPFFGSERADVSFWNSPSTVATCVGTHTNANKVQDFRSSKTSKVQVWAHVC